MKVIRLIIAVCVLLTMSVAKAEVGDTTVVRPISTAITLDIGRAHNLDTYLSPVRYKGLHIAVGYEHLRATAFRPETWVNQVSVSAGYDKLQNPVKNNTMHNVRADVDWTMMRKFEDVFVNNLNLFVGPCLSVEGGVVYNPNNSNNVCSPNIYANIGATAMATYRFKVGGLPVTARYQPSLSALGVYYLPDYDQSFYEIYLGNYRDAVNFGWWGNRFDMDNYLSLDLHLGSTALRLGYRNEFSTLWKNNISVQRCVHSFVLGVSWESVRLNPRKSLDKVKYFSAGY